MVNYTFIICTRNQYYIAETFTNDRYACKVCTVFIGYVYVGCELLDTEAVAISNPYIFIIIALLYLGALNPLIAFFRWMILILISLLLPA